MTSWVGGGGGGGALLLVFWGWWPPGGGGGGGDAYFSFVWVCAPQELRLHMLVWEFLRFSALCT